MRTEITKTLMAASLAVLAVAAAPADAEAFCGFYVTGADAKLYNDATQVVLMRDGTKTILSMENNYQGPAKDFAMVVPVPVVLQEDNVKTLPSELFRKIDALTAPRLVEYWEQDPCSQFGFNNRDFAASPNSGGNNSPENESDPGTVTVEAEFSVGEYDIVVLSSDKSTALNSWLVDNKYNIPAGAEQTFTPYIDAGMYFFVAKIDASKVTYDKGRAVLSPLRFHYDSQDFQLPIRLGLINAQAEQDLIVHVLAKGKRYEVANYPNATIPTNIEVVNDVRHDFATFYNKLFERTLQKNPGAVITEYSWDASTCDPCPGPALSGDDFATLGADILLGDNEPSDPWSFNRGWTITRLHARYDKHDMIDDLVFRQADPIVGGRERYDENGKLETGVKPSDFGSDNFQGRYIIRHRWDGPVDCANPQFGNWGGPPGQSQPPIFSAPGPNSQPKPTEDQAGDDKIDISPRNLPELVAEDVPEIDVQSDNPADAQIGGGNSGGGCSSTQATGASLPAALLLLMGLIGLRRRRRKLLD